MVSPLPTNKGPVLRWLLNDTHSIAVFPNVEGAVRQAYGSEAERRRVVSLLVELHQSAELVKELARGESFRLPNRTDLEAALQSVEERWTGGPYSEPARSLLRRHLAEVRQALAEYDELAQSALRDRSGWTITHGEPHSANVLRTSEGLRVIDWYTALLAPPERDLRMLLSPNAGGSLPRHYTETTGHSIDADILRLYALWWDLCEIGIYLALFRSEHADTEDSRVSWGGLQESITVAQRWAE